MQRVPRSVELSPDPAFAHRVRRLAVVSAIALGLLWWLARAMPGVPRAVPLALLGGWILMPLTLAASLRWAPVRVLVALPATLVGGALVAISFLALPRGGVARAGWITITAGVLLGGFLGAWFWYRWLPVPASLDDPFARGRKALIGVHAALIVIGLLLVVLARRG